MSAAEASAPLVSEGSDGIKSRLAQYGCGSIPLADADDALYERHLTFDNVLDPEAAGARERFEAIAHTVRGILSRRWLRTQQAYARENPKRVYYLSMEFLIGRSLANTVTALLFTDAGGVACLQVHHRRDAVRRGGIHGFC